MAAGATTTVVVGAGHSGLAMSKRLADGGVDHAVLERHEVASSWQRQRWDSFTLLTPNWQTTLPGRSYDGDAPDDFMNAVLRDGEWSTRAITDRRKLDTFKARDVMRKMAERLKPPVFEEGFAKITVVRVKSAS